MLNDPFSTTISNGSGFKDVKFVSHKIMEEVPTMESLELANALLFSVYGWNIKKVGNMRLSSIVRWVDYAKKKMTWEDAYRLRRLDEPQKKSLRRTIKRIIKKWKS